MNCLEHSICISLVLMCLENAIYVNSPLAIGGHCTLYKYRVHACSTYLKEIIGSMGHLILGSGDIASCKMNIIYNKCIDISSMIFKRVL